MAAKAIINEKSQIAEIKARLQEAEDTLDAIRHGSVDALVVSSQNEQEVFTLRSADYSYRVLIESMNQGAVTMNFDGTILYSNKQFSVMLERPLEKIIGTSFLDLTTVDDKRVVDTMLRSGQGSNTTFEVNLQTASGKPLTVIASATTVTQPNVNPYLCVVVTDMTERKRAEEAKDEFISLASHQLRTPATAVKQYINMVLDGLFGDISSAQRDALQRANNSNERELRIVEDLLKVAQIDAGKIIMNRSSIDIAKLTEEVITDQRSQIETHQQKIEYHIPPAPAYAYVDEVLIRMVIENLLDNASKYMPEQGLITVTVSSKKGKTYITITDKGVGMSAEDISKLFQKFARMPNRLSIKVGGNGLGLYWVKKVIDLHDAEITVSSVVDSGTTFTVTLSQEDSGVKDISRR